MLIQRIMILFRRLIFGLGMVFATASCSTVEREKKDVVTALPFHDMPLESLEDFTSQDHSPAWRIAHNVLMDRQTNELQLAEGKGTLLFNGKDGRSALLTKLVHHDLDLALDFMLAKDAAAQLYFQGRYAIQLSDSWKQDSITAATCGAIRLAEGTEATTPMLNASKAPGLWQHLYVRFKAPRFDSSGKKISDAVFKEVFLNGKLIHEDVVVNEVLAGEALTQNDSAAFAFVAEGKPVAFQRIRYKAYGDDRIRLTDVKFAVYKGLFKAYDTLQRLTPLRTGSADSLHWGLGDKRSQVLFEGSMNILSSGDYLFKLRAGGPAWLVIDDREVVNNRNTRDYTDAFYGSISLDKGHHHFKIIYANYDESLVLEYEGPGIPLTSLTALSSERKVRTAEPFEYQVSNEPALQRGFFIHKGKVNPYTMAVGTPYGLNYTYDLNTFNLLSVWRGKFIDVSNMWTERGESQLEIPLGATLELPGIPGLLALNSRDDTWTDTVSVEENIYTKRGYQVGENGHPVFFYTYKGVNIRDQFMVGENRSGLVRTITATFTQPEKGLYFLLGSGRNVEQLPSGGFAIDDKEYYIDSIEGVDADEVMIVKAKNQRYELLLPLQGETNKSLVFNYSIIW